MKKSILSFASLLAALSLSSCFQQETTIHLKKDGSGTVVEETRLSSQMLGMMSMNQVPPGAEATHKGPLDDLLSEEKAKARATELGEGVTLVKVEPVTVGTSKGARATYRFSDINKLRISTDEAMKDMSPAGGMPDAAKPDAKKNKPIGFNYKDGVLTMRPNAEMKGDKPNAGKKPDAAAPLNDAQGMAMMKQMFTDMKISFKLVADSGIAETNATHRTGDTITLMDMDMNKLMGS
ncbi:MAG: hypothetical protein K8R87_03250 [Verrucomicrobia bacterium]|nr:hypothetical protein [Verrucomicrobiota bacterium]